jgi:hypothetical protein
MRLNAGSTRLIASDKVPTRMMWNTLTTSRCSSGSSRVGEEIAVGILKDVDDHGYRGPLAGRGRAVKTGAAAIAPLPLPPPPR